MNWEREMINRNLGIEVSIDPDKLTSNEIGACAKKLAEKSANLSYDLTLGDLSIAQVASILIEAENLANLAAGILVAKCEND